MVEAIHSRHDFDGRTELTLSCQDERGQPMKRTLTTTEFANYPEDWHLSPVLDIGDFVFFSGVTGRRADLSVAEDPETQFRDAFGFLGDYLAVAGLSFSDVVEMTTYHVDLRRHLKAFIKVKDEFVRPPIRPGPPSA
jgi:enamine deaminase RidA (YjgF/YER057c/UK114 family)